MVRSTRSWLVLALTLLAVGCGGGGGESGDAGAPGDGGGAGGGTDPLPANEAPTASISAPASADELTVVMLDGSASSDPEGAPLGFQWTQLGGPTIQINDATTAMPSFTAPEVAADSTVTIQLQVTDGVGATGVAQVGILITDIPVVNQPPTANAGDDQVVASGDTVTLAGAGADPEGTTVTFAWTQPVGPAVMLSDATIAGPTFTAPTVAADTTLTFQLTVTDAGGESSTDQVDVVVGPAATGQAVLGPIVGAQVEIFDASNPDGTALFVTTTLDGATLDEAGRFRVPAALLAADALYVVRITGGQDVDADDDGVRDAVPTDFQGTIRAIGTRDDLLADIFRVNALTEVAYQGVVDLLADQAPQADIRAGLDLAAQRQLSVDVNGDGTIDGRDLLAFRPREDAAAYSRGTENLRKLNEGLLDGSTSASELADQAAILLGRFAGFSGQLGALAAENGIVVTADATGLRIVSIEDPVRPKIVATLESVRGALDVVLSNGIAYVGGNGLTIVDVRTPASPVVLGTIATGLVDELELAGNLLYVAQGLRGLAIVNVTDPAVPVIAGELAVTQEDDYTAITVAGNLAYVANGSRGLDIVDVADPALPLRLSTTPIDPNQGAGVNRDARGVHVSGTTLYLNVGPAGLAVFDVSTPAAPRQIGALLTGIRKGTELVGDRLHAVSNDGLLFVDVSDPVLPIIDAQVDVDGSDVVESGGTLLVATRQGELVLVDADASVASSRSLRVQLGATEDLALVGNRLYAADGTAGFSILDVSTPMDPKLLARATGAGNIRDLAVGEGRVYAAEDMGGIRIFDTNVEGPPALIGTIPTDFRVRDIEVIGTAILFITGGQLRVFETVDAADPQEVAALPVSGAFIELVGTRAYVTGSDGATIVDVTSLSVPTVLGVAIPGEPVVEHVVVDGTTAYLLSTRVISVDVTDPAAPTELGRSERVGRAGGLVQAGPRLFAAGTNSGIRIIDIADPAMPVPRDLLETIGSNPVDVATDGEFLFVANLFSGLEIRRIPTRTRDTLPFD